MSTLLSFLGYASTRQVSFACDTPTLQSDFDATKYVGTWYEIKRDAVFNWELNANCVTAQYSLNSDGSLKVVNS